MKCTSQDWMTAFYTAMDDVTGVVAVCMIVGCLFAATFKRIR